MKSNKVFTPPKEWDNSVYLINGELPLNVFLAGTIDNGDSLDWQSAVINELNDFETKRAIIVYNPRRENWDKETSHEEIDKQITWELYHLERANLIVMNILGDSKSPISLMELGLFAKEHKVIVFCPPTFYRYDNVRMVCKRYNVPLYETNDILAIKNKILERANE